MQLALGDQADDLRRTHGPPALSGGHRPPQLHSRPEIRGTASWEEGVSEADGLRVVGVAATYCREPERSSSLRSPAVAPRRQQSGVERFYRVESPPGPGVALPKTAMPY